MRYTITSQQFDFFRSEGHIEFEGLFSEEEAEALKTLLDAAEKNQPHGRDLERNNLPLRKAMQLSRLAQAAFGLTKKSPLRLAFTQYPIPFKETQPLTSFSSVSETIGFALVNLSENSHEELTSLPQHFGDVGFYADYFSFDFSQLHFPCLLIVFATEKARYQLQKADPNTHFLKKLSYAFGDRLTEETHPIVLR